MSVASGGADPPALHDLACVIHLHSTYSDGTATVEELIAAAHRAERDVVLLTDHDTLAAKDAGWEGWHGDVLLGVGVEVSSKHGHYLAFGVEQPIKHRGVPIADIPDAVRAAGGVGFAAHPFSQGSLMAPNVGKPHGWGAMDDPRLAGIELWSLTTDAAEAWRNPWDAIKYLVSPASFLDGPPRHHLDAWDRLGADARVAAIGGLDAHQTGIRRGSVVVSPMPNTRYFRLLSTYALCRRAPTGDAGADLAEIYEALAAGRCFLSVDSFAPGRGFRYWGEGACGRAEMGEEHPAADWTLRAELPRPARMVLRRDGEAIDEINGRSLAVAVGDPGVYRIEAWLHRRGRDRPWIYSNPIYLRAGMAVGD